VSYSVRGEEPVLVEALRMRLFLRVAMTIYWSF
jgi:hypothetical protein